MKKTLVALAVTAFAASATAKVDLYNQDGTSISIDGRVHVVAHKETTKVKGEKTKDSHSNLSNSGTRLGFNVRHNITDDFYALGRFEARFDGDAKNGSNWGNAYAKRAYVGLGHKDFGQVTFGRQLLIGDDVGRIGLDNYYGVGSEVVSGTLDNNGKNKGFGWAILNEASDSAVRYEYTGIKGLTLGADYSFANKHDTGEAEKNGYGLGGIYEFEAGAGTASVSLGYAHKDIESTTNNKVNQDGVFGGFNYVINGVKFGVDGGYSVRRHKDDSKEKLGYVRAGVRYEVANSGVYANYSHVVVKKDAEESKNKAHRFLVGTDYKFHKNVKVYVEGQVDKLRFADQTKITDKKIATGLVVYW